MNIQYYFLHIKLISVAFLYCRTGLPLVGVSAYITPKKIREYATNPDPQT